MKLLFINLFVLWCGFYFFIQNAHAQWPVFRVYHVEGLIKYKTSGQSPFKPIFKSVYLYKGDTILLLNDKADIILFDRDTNYIQINFKGKYSVAEIQKMQKTHMRDDITAKYARLLWEDVFKPANNGLNSDKEAIANSAGGVSRGLSMVIAPGLRYRTSMDKQLFRWEKISWARLYRLRMTNPSGADCYNQLTTDSQLYVHFKGPLTYGNTYHWTLEIIGEGSRTQDGENGYLELIDEKKVLPTISLRRVDSLPGLANELQWIELYEDNGCIKKALSVYLNLLKKYPNDRALKQLYYTFTKQNFLKD